MGTPQFAETILEDLVQHHEVVAVFTRPDAVRKRGTVKEASPVKQCAEREGIPVFTPQSLRNEEIYQQLRELDPDIICVAAYGALLPREILDIPRFGCLNVHASLLPAWRGAAPVERAILHDDVETGVCIMRMEEGLDTGDYCICRTTNIEDKSSEELSDELANLGSHALLTALIHVEEQAADWIKQDDNLVSYADKLGKGELNISPYDSARQAILKVRASGPAHPSRCVLAHRKVTLICVRDISDDEHALELTKDLGQAECLYREKRLFIGAYDAALEILEVKPDGKQTMDAKSFMAGVHNNQSEVMQWDTIDV